MAKIQLGAVITNITGCVGGSRFWRNKSGLVMSNKPSGIISSNTNNVDIKSIYSFLILQWRTLTEQQRNIWNEWAKFIKMGQFGNQFKFLSGQEAFIKVNTYLKIYKNTFLTYPYFEYNLVPDTTCEISATPDNIYISTNRELDPTEEFLILFLSRPVSTSINNPGSRLRMILFDSDNGQDRNITTEYEKALGTQPEPFQTIFVKWALFSFLQSVVTTFRTQKQEILIHI